MEVQDKDSHPHKKSKNKPEKARRCELLPDPKCSDALHQEPEGGTEIRAMSCYETSVVFVNFSTSYGK